MEIANPILLSLVLFVLIICSVSADAAGARGEGGDCLPQLADRCFTNVLDSLLCQIEKQSCNSHFCSLAADSLQCAADIIDTDCPKGRKTFDPWLKGLKAAQEKICYNNAKLIRDVTDVSGMPCFNILDFLACVEDKTNITHVHDLVNISFKCNHLLMITSTCNVRAHPAYSYCHSAQDLISDVIYSFFSQCGGPSLGQTSQTMPRAELSPLLFCSALSLVLATLIE